MYTKGCSGFILFCLDLDLFAKIKKRTGFFTLTETIFINNSRSEQNKKKRKKIENPFVGIAK